MSMLGPVDVTMLMALLQKNSSSTGEFFIDTQMLVATVMILVAFQNLSRPSQWDYSLFGFDSVMFCRQGSKSLLEVRHARRREETMPWILDSPACFHPLFMQPYALRFELVR